MVLRPVVASAPVPTRKSVAENGTLMVGAADGDVGVPPLPLPHPAKHKAKTAKQTVSLIALVYPRPIYPNF